MSESPNVLVDTLQLEKSGLLRFLQSRLGCPEAAADVYQIMSEQLYSSPPGADVTQPRAYLFKAAANAATSHQRAERTRARYEATAAEHQEDTDFRDPERVTLGERALQIVDTALAELPVLTRQMFVAYRYRGEPQKEIARRFGVSLSTVEKRVAAATLHCHRKLRASGLAGER